VSWERRGEGSLSVTREITRPRVLGSAYSRAMAESRAWKEGYTGTRMGGQGRGGQGRTCRRKGEDGECGEQRATVPGTGVGTPNALARFARR